MERPYHLQAYSPYIQFEQVPQTNAWAMMSSMYQQGIRNIEIAFCPKKHLPVLEAAHYHWLQRVKHIVIGALLCLPIVQLITYVVLRYFAKKIQVNDDNDDFELKDAKPAIVIKKKIETPAPAPIQKIAEVEEIEAEEIEKVPLQSIIEQNKKFEEEEVDVENPEEVEAPADKQEVQEVDGVVAVEEDQEQDTRILEQNFQCLIEAMPAYNAARGLQTMGLNDYIYNLQLEMNDKGEIYKIRNQDSLKEVITKAELEHHTTYTIDARIWLTRGTSPNNVFKLNTPFEELDNPKPPHLIQKMLEDLASQFKNIVARIQQELSSKTVDEQINWLTNNLLEAPKHRLKSWQWEHQYRDISHIILLNWDQLQHLFVEQNKKFEEEVDVENPEEVEAPADKQKVQEVEGVVAVEEDQEEDTQILEQNMQFLIQDFPNAKARRRTFTIGGPGHHIYEFELQMNGKGEIYRLKEAFFQEGIKVRDVEHNTLYNIEFKVCSLSYMPFNKAFQYTLSENDKAPIDVIQMADDLVAQFKNTAERIMQQFSSKTKDEQADWLAANIQNRVSSASYKRMLEEQTLWGIIFHSWDQLQHLFV